MRGLPVVPEERFKLDSGKCDTEGGINQHRGHLAGRLGLRAAAVARCYLVDGGGPEPPDNAVIVKTDVQKPATRYHHPQLFPVGGGLLRLVSLSCLALGIENCSRENAEK